MVKLNRGPVWDGNLPITHGVNVRPVRGQWAGNVGGADPQRLIASLFERLPECWVSVDPGDRNVGLSVWHGPICIRSVHTNPIDLADWLEQWLGPDPGQVGLVVFEAFNLQGGKMAMQQGSEFLTSQLIGVIRHLCRRAGVAALGFRPSDHKRLMSNLMFKTPLKLDREWASYGHGGHAKDSENLGEYYVRRMILQGKGY